MMTHLPPATYRGEADPIWVLVPNLKFERETDKAVLFTHQIEEREVWLPKSELHMSLAAFTTLFTGMSKWIAGKKDLVWEAVFIGQEISLEWLMTAERLYEQNLLGEAKDLMEWSKKRREENNPSLARARALKEWSAQKIKEIERQFILPLKAKTEVHVPPPKRSRLIREEE